MPWKNHTSFFWYQTKRNRTSPVTVKPSDKWQVRIGIPKPPSCTSKRKNDSYICRSETDAKAFAFAYAYYGFSTSTNIDGHYNNTNHQDACVPVDPRLRTHIKRPVPRGFGAKPFMADIWLSSNTLLRGMTMRVKQEVPQDLEYCDLPPPQPSGPDPVASVEVDPQVYQRFKEGMNIQKNGDWTQKSMSGNQTSMWHGVTVRDFPSVVALNKGVPVHHSTLGGSYLYATKPAGYKKDGRRRNVFVMSPKLNAYVTQEYGEQLPKYPDNVTVRKDPRDFTPFKYSYDVKSCDHRVLPYFRQLIRETFPLDEDILLAHVYDGLKFSQLTQFPSGIAVFMKHINSVFTTALLDLGNLPGTFQIQGDGVASDIELFHPYIDAFPKGEINGFRITEDGYEYVAGLGKLFTPIDLFKNRIHGSELWEYRRAVYQRVLNAKNTLHLPVKNQHHADRFARMTINQLAAVSDSESRWIKSNRESDKVPTWDGIRTLGAIGLQYNQTNAPLPTPQPTNIFFDSRDELPQSYGYRGKKK